MGNCLVTRLKGTVNNDNLYYLNELCLDVLQDAEQNLALIRIAPPANGSVKIFLTGDANSYLQIGGQTYREFSNITTVTEVYVHKGSGETKLHIENAYDNLGFLFDALSYTNALKVARPETLKYCKNLSIYRAIGNQGIEGDILGNFTCTGLASIMTVYDDTSRLTGDLSLAPESTYGINFAGLSLDNYHHVTWKNTRPDTARIITMSGLDFGDDVDAMLINQARCVKFNYDPVIIQGYYISVKGNRTSASDAAVAALKELGYTISVNGEAL